MRRKGTNRLTTFVWAGMVLVGLVAIGLFATNVLRVASAVDAHALEREAGSMDQGLRLVAELSAAESISLSFWSEAYRNTTTDPSQPWMRRNFGRAVFSEPAEQRLAVIDPAGAVLFESSVGTTPQRREAAAILGAARPLLLQLSARYRDVLGADGEADRRHGDGLVEGLYTHGFALLNDRPVLMVASPILPDVGDAELPDRPAVLLDIRYLTPAFLDRLGAMAHLDGVRLDGPRAAASTTLLGAGGGLVGRLSWTHVAPGSAVLQSMRPALVASIGLVALLALCGGHVLRSRARALADSAQAALFASRHDAATGLANRGWFLDELERLSAAPGHRAVVLIDCDHFKTINDTLGHAAGDAVLKALAERLQALDGPLELAGRLGGDEFAAVTRATPGTYDLAALLTRVAGSLMQPVDVDGSPIPLSVSMGAAPLARTATADASLRQADAALYRAKRDGRGCWRIQEGGPEGAEAETAARVDAPLAFRQAA